MRTALAEELGAGYPIFAFSHCRDVVTAVTNLGGVGVLGTTRQTPEELQYDLRWIEDRVGDRPYAVDLLFPAALEATSGTNPEAAIPAAHWEFVEQLAERFHIPPPRDTHLYSKYGDNLIPEHERARGKLATIMKHRVPLVASALGPLPADLMSEFKQRGTKIIGLVGAPGHASRHVAAGADIVVATGTEAGGHTGEISTMVLVPQVVDEVAPVPVLAAGGIGDGRQIAAALALGAQGVWMGSAWLATVESDLEEQVKQKLVAATSRDTLRSRCLTGKPVRQLRTDWVQAWESPQAPAPLPAPLQGMLVRNTMTGIFEGKVEPVMGTAVGQVVGQIDRIRPARALMDDLIEGFADSASRLAALLDAE